MKIMKNLAIVLLLVTGASNLPAQTVTATIENQSRYLKNYFLRNNESHFGFEDGEHIIQVEVTGVKTRIWGVAAKYGHTMHGIILRKVDSNDKVVKENKLDGGKDVFGPIRSEAIEFNGKIYLFYYRYIDKIKMELYVSEIDKSTLEITNTRTLHSYAEKNTSVFAKGDEFRRYILLTESPDQKKLLLSVAGEKETDLFTAVFDHTGNIVFTKNTTLEKETKASVNKAAFTNQGNIAVVFSEWIQPRMEPYRQWKAKALVLINPDKTEKQFDFGADQAGGELYHPVLKFSADDSKFYIGGDYDGELRKAGVWLKEIALKDFKAGKIQRFPYPEEFIKNIHEIGFGFKRKGNIGINGADFQLIELPNNRLLLGGSPLYRYSNNNPESYRTIYFTGPIMMVTLDANRKASFAHIPRYNNSSSGDELAFKPYQNKLVVVYNDYEKNITGPLKPNDVNQKGGAVVRELSLAYAVVDEKGNIEKRAVLSPGISRLWSYNMYEAKWTDNNTLMIPASGKDKKEKELKVAKVEVR